MIAGTSTRASLEDRHARLRQQHRDFAGQGHVGLITGADGVVLMARSTLDENVPADSEWPTDGAISTLPEKGMSDSELRAGTARLLKEEEGDQLAFQPQRHLRADGMAVQVPAVPVTLRPGPFQVAHMGRKDWYVQGGTAKFPRNVWSEIGELIRNDFVLVQIADTVIPNFPQGWICARLRGSMETVDEMLITNLEIVAAENGLETDYRIPRDEFGQAHPTISHGMVLVAYVISPGRRGNSEPVIVPMSFSGDFTPQFQPALQLFK